MLSIVSITLPIAAFAVPPYLIATFKVFSKFGALKGRSYYKILQHQILKTLLEEKNIVRELRRCDGRVHMFQCLVMYISRDTIYYSHAQARYNLLSHDSRDQSRVWRSSMFLEHSIGRCAAARWCLALGERFLVSFHRRSIPRSAGRPEKPFGTKSQVQGPVLAPKPKLRTSAVVQHQLV